MRVLGCGSGGKGGSSPFDPGWGVVKVVKRLRRGLVSWYDGDTRTVRQAPGSTVRHTIHTILLPVRLGEKRRADFPRVRAFEALLRPSGVRMDRYFVPILRRDESACLITGCAR